MQIKIDPNKTENKIADRIRSMLESVKRYGTSQPQEEWVTYSNASTYRGFACIIAHVPVKKKFPVEGDIASYVDSTRYGYKGMARQIKPDISGGKLITFETQYMKNVNDAGRLIYKYIDLYRDRKN